MARSPLVSVLMPVFNAGAFLRPALESLRQQSLEDFEVIVMDDGSVDGSREVLAAYSLLDSRFRIYRTNQNQGIPQARNQAFEHAQGRFLAWLNHDDLALPRRLERQVEYLSSHPEIGVLGCTREMVDPQGVVLKTAPLPTTHLGLVWKGLLDCPLIHSGLMARHDPIRQYALRYDPQYPVHSDFDFFVRLLRVTQGATLPEVLCRYCVHNSNTSKLRRRELEDAGHRIAFANIRHELPEVPATLDDVAAIRGIYSGCQTVELKDLARVKRGWQLLYDLRDAFRRKHVGHPQIHQIEFP